jgi:Na+/melibiose symporter-like transporter
MARSKERLDAAYRRLVAAAGISALGARIAREGLPLTAVLVLGASPTALGVLAAMRAAPAILTGLAAGPLVDRANRRGLMILADLLRAGLVGLVPLLAFAHALSLIGLFLIAAAVGAASVLFDMASHALVPAMVPSARLSDANAALEGVDAAGEVAGPSLAGILISLLGAPIAVGLNATTYLASGAILAIRGRGADREAHATPGPGEAPAVLSLGSGLAIAWDEPRVRPLLLMAGASSLAGGIFSAIYIVFAVRTLGLTPAMLGFTVTMGGVGGLAGAAAAPWLGRMLGLGHALLLGAVLQGAFTGLIPLAGGSPIVGMLVLMAAQLFGDAAGTVTYVLQATARQTVLPPQTLGRTAGAFAAVNGLALTIGALGGGVLGGAIGLRAAMMVSAAGLLLAPGFGMTRSLRRL